MRPRDSHFLAPRNIHLRHSFIAATIFSGVRSMAIEINTDGGGSAGGGNVVLGFILGAVLLAVAVVGFLMWDNYKSGGAPKAIVVTGQNK